MRQRLCLSIAVLMVHAGAPASWADNVVELEPITVTAQKRIQDIQDVPVVVSAVSGAELVQHDVKDLLQAAVLIPGVVFSRAPDDGLALTFRGLGTTSRSQAFDLSEALFVDGTFMGKGRLYTTSFFDVDRIEFIKGTESTLLGKNASFGAISIVTQQPSSEPSFEGRGGYEFIDHGYRIDGAGNTPLGDRNALRVAVHYNDLDGWVHNDVTDHNGPEQKELGLRATLRSSITESLTTTLKYQYSDDQRIGAAAKLVGNIPASFGSGVLNGPTSQFTPLTSDGDTFHRTISDIVSLKADFQLGRGHTLILQSSYVHYALKFIDNLCFCNDGDINFLRDERYDQFTQEFRVQSPNEGRLQYMAGLFYLASQWHSFENQRWGVEAFPPPPAPTSGQLFYGPFLNDYDQHSRSYSVFASGGWHFTDSLRLSGGIRATRETKDVLYGRTAEAPFTIWNSIANPPFDPTPLTHDSNFFDANVALQYDLARDVMAYAAFGHGSKAGGFTETNTVTVAPALLVNGKVPAGLVAAGTAIKDEFTRSYEVGIKSTLLDHRLRLNVAGFWTDVKDFQDTVFTGGQLGFITFNGPARTRGAELESVFLVTQGFRVTGGLTLADATGVIQPINPVTGVPEVNPNGTPIYGNYRRAQAPKAILNAGTDYQTPISNNLTLHVGADVRYRSSMYNQRQEEFPSSSLTTVDLFAGVASADEKWGVDLGVKNLSNAVAEDFASPAVDPRFTTFYGAYEASSNQTRTFWLSARVKL